MDADAVQSAMVTLRIRRSDHELMKQIAHAKGESFSDWARRVLVAAMKRRK